MKGPRQERKDTRKMTAHSSLSRKRTFFIDEFKRWEEWNKHVLEDVVSNGNPKHCPPLQKNIPPDP
jgi:hypothetical protein